MRNVARAPEPQVLVRTRKVWAEQLCEEIERCRQTGEKVADKFFDKYQHDDIRDALSSMYRKYCCYCEAKITTVSYAHIEHRKPKRKFCEEAFLWDNLHFACEKCNEAKGQKWKAGAPILDACVDPIDHHLTYRESNTGLRRWPANESARGQMTIDHARLNRESQDGLPGDRTAVYMETLRSIHYINRLEIERPGSPTVRACVAELRDNFDGQFGSVIAWASCPQTRMT